MKNLFLLKKFLICFSFGKDSFFSYYNCFYKKKNFFFINFHKFKLKNIFFLKKISIFILLKKIKINFLNELLMRKIRISFLKNKNNIFFLKNHHLIDKLEYLFLLLLKNKKITNFVNNWYFKKNLFIKPYFNFLTKKYFNLIDKSNKFIFFDRNFIRCLFSNFLK